MVNTTRDLVHVALFTAFVVVLGLIPPAFLTLFPVPITLQSLGVMLAGSLLGARRGALALLLFLLLIAIGLPVLAGGRGGIGVLLGPSGGFLLAFPLGAYVIGWLTEHLGPGHYNLFYALAFNLIGGILVLYALGIPWLALVAHLGWEKAFFGSLAFVPGDLVKVALTAFVVIGVQRAYPLLQQSSRVAQ